MQRDPDQLLEQLLREVQALRAEVRELKTATNNPSLSIQQAQDALGCSRAKVFELLKEGKLQRGKRVGKAATVTRESLEAFQQPQPAKTRAQAPAKPNGKPKNDNAEPLEAQLARLKI